jgi:hypothetical protein
MLFELLAMFSSELNIQTHGVISQGISTDREKLKSHLLMKSSVVYNIMPYSPLKVCRSFGGYTTYIYRVDKKAK